VIPLLVRVSGSVVSIAGGCVGSVQDEVHSVPGELSLGECEEVFHSEILLYSTLLEWLCVGGALGASGRLDGGSGRLVGAVQDVGPGLYRGGSRVRDHLGPE
jgi:hypothetical protein